MNWLGKYKIFILIFFEKLNRIIINNVPIELDKYVLNDLLSKAIDTINEWVVLNKQKLT